MPNREAFGPKARRDRVKLLDIMDSQIMKPDIKRRNSLRGMAGIRRYETDLEFSAEMARDG